MFVLTLVLLDIPAPLSSYGLFLISNKLCTELGSELFCALYIICAVL